MGAPQKPHQGTPEKPRPPKKTPSETLKNTQSQNNPSGSTKNPLNPTQKYPETPQNPLRRSQILIGSHPSRGPRPAPRRIRRLGGSQSAVRSPGRAPNPGRPRPPPVGGQRGVVATPNPGKPPNPSRIYGIDGNPNIWDIRSTQEIGLRDRETRLGFLGTHPSFGGSQGIWGGIQGFQGISRFGGEPKVRDLGDPGHPKVTPTFGTSGLPRPLG